MDYMAKVENGAAVLDREVPGWIFSINLDTLDIASLGECVLGQLFGSFWTGMSEVFGDAGSPEVAVTCGFEIDADGDYAALTEAWISFIDNRLAEV